jgi:hypothetical protein
MNPAFSVAHTFMQSCGKPVWLKTVTKVKPLSGKINKELRKG